MQPRLPRSRHAVRACLEWMTTWLDQVQEVLRAIPEDRAITYFAFKYPKGASPMACVCAGTAFARAVELLVTSASTSQGLQRLWLDNKYTGQLPIDTLYRTLPLSLPRPGGSHHKLQYEYVGRRPHSPVAGPPVLHTPHVTEPCVLRGAHTSHATAPEAVGPAAQAVPAGEPDSDASSPPALLPSCIQLRELCWPAIDREQDFQQSELDELAAALQGMPHLEELRMDGVDMGVAGLAKCHALRRVELRALLVRPADMEALQGQPAAAAAGQQPPAAPAPAAVEELEVQTVTCEGVPEEGCLARVLPQLKSFTLSATGCIWQQPAASKGMMAPRPPGPQKLHQLGERWLPGGAHKLGGVSGAAAGAAGQLPRPGGRRSGAASYGRARRRHACGRWHTAACAVAACSALTCVWWVV